MDKKRLVKVTNRSHGIVFYDVEDLGISRHYERNETKEVPFEEIQKLSYQPGGLVLLQDYLCIEDEAAVQELLGEVEPEYYYTVDDVKKLLVNGSLEQLEDCLDFADQGVIDLVKDLSVKLEINSVAKRQAIQDKTGFNVNHAIEINHITQEEDTKNTTPTRRRTAPITTKQNEVKSSGRRTALPQYKVTSMK